MEQEGLADAKVSARQLRVYEGPYSKEIYSKSHAILLFARYLRA